MPRLPTLQAREFGKFLEWLGFQEARVRSSHHIFAHPDGRTTVVPMHKGEDLDRGLMRKILREIHSAPEELQKWLQGDAD